MPAGKPGGLFESMRCGDDQQQEQITGAHPRKPLPDSDPTCDPSLYGASEQRASPRCEHADMGGGDDSIGTGSGCPRIVVKEVICGIPGTASLCSKNVGGPSGATTRERCVETRQGGDMCMASAGIGSGARSYL